MLRMVSSERPGDSINDPNDLSSLRDPWGLKEDRVFRRLDEERSLRMRSLKASLDGAGSRPTSRSLGTVVDVEIDLEDDSEDCEPSFDDTSSEGA